MQTRAKRRYRICSHGFAPTEVAAFSLAEALNKVRPVVALAFEYAQVAPETGITNDRSIWPWCREDTGLRPFTPSQQANSALQWRVHGCEICGIRPGDGGVHGDSRCPRYEHAEPNADGSWSGAVEGAVTKGSTLQIELYNRIQAGRPGALGNGWLVRVTSPSGRTSFVRFDRDEQGARAFYEVVCGKDGGL
jgi:hypothetical protein